MMLNFLQNSVVMIGLVVGCFYCFTGRSFGSTQKNAFIVFLNYMNQIYTPMSWIESYVQY